MQDCDIGVATEYLWVLLDEIIIQEADELVGSSASIGAEDACYFRVSESCMKLSAALQCRFSEVTGKRWCEEYFDFKS